MKLLITLSLIFFHFQISAQDTLTFLRIYFQFEIESPTLIDLYLESNVDSKHRYQFKEVERTPLLAQKLVTIDALYNSRWNFSNYLEYRESRNFFRKPNEHSVIVGHIFPRDNYLSSYFESYINSDIVFNYSYSNEIYFEDFSQPSSLYASRIHFNFPKDFVTQRFIDWTPIGFPLFNDPFNNIARMNFNFVVNPKGKFFVKTETEYNFIFLKNGQERFRTFIFGVGARPIDETLIFININQLRPLNLLSSTIDTTWTLNIRQNLNFKIKNILRN